MEHGVVGVTGDEQDLEIVANGGQALGQFAAAHLRHHHVGDQQVDGALVLGADLDGVRAVGRFQHGIALAAQNLADQRADTGFVLHHQDGLNGHFVLGGGGLVRRPGSNGLNHLRRRLFGRSRKRDAEGGAFARFADHRDVAAALLDDVVSAGQCQPLFPRGLIGDQPRFKESVAIFILQARAGVRHRKDYVRPWARVACAVVFVQVQFGGRDRDLAQAMHFEFGMERQRGEGLLQERLIHLHHAAVRLDVHGEFHTVAQVPAQGRFHVAQQRVDVQHFRLEGHFAGVLLELAGEALHALSGPHDLLHVVMQARSRRDAVFHLFAIAGDDHQQVVKVVCDFGGQASQGFDLVGLNGLVLGLAPAGDIERYARHLGGGARAVAGDANYFPHPQRSPVGRQCAEFHHMAGAGIAYAPVEIGNAFAVVGMHSLQPETGIFNPTFGIVAQQLGSPLAHVDEADGGWVARPDTFPDNGVQVVDQSIGGDFNGLGRLGKGRLGGRFLRGFWKRFNFYKLFEHGCYGRFQHGRFQHGHYGHFQHGRRRKQRRVGFGRGVHHGRHSGCRNRRAFQMFDDDERFGTGVELPPLQILHGNEAVGLFAGELKRSGDAALRLAGGHHLLNLFHQAGERENLIKLAMLQFVIPHAAPFAEILVSGNHHEIRPDNQQAYRYVGYDLLVITPFGLDQSQKSCDFFWFPLFEVNAIHLCIGLPMNRIARQDAGDKSTNLLIRLSTS